MTTVKCPNLECKYEFDGLCTRGEIEMGFISLERGDIAPCQNYTPMKPGDEKDVSGN